MDERDDRGRTLVTAGVVGVGGYLAYRWWVHERLKAALLADAQRQLAANPGMSIKDALTNAGAGACVAVAAAKLKMPPEQSGPMCKGLAVVATKAVELGAKGAVIAGKAIGKGTVAATKAVGKAATVVGKGVATGAKAVAYTAPKKVIGGTVNTADKLVTKAVKAVIPDVVEKAIAKAVPKPVAKAATTAKKVAKKVLCLGIFCGLDGLEDPDAAAYRDQVDRQLGPGRVNPLRRVQRARAARRGANPFALAALEPMPAVGAASRPSVRVALRSPGRRQARTPARGAASYERLLRR